MKLVVSGRPVLDTARAYTTNRLHRAGTGFWSNIMDAKVQTQTQTQTFKINGAIGEEGKIAFTLVTSAKPHPFWLMVWWAVFVLPVWMMGVVVIYG